MLCISRILRKSKLLIGMAKYVCAYKGIQLNASPSLFSPISIIPTSSSRCAFFPGRGKNRSTFYLFIYYFSIIAEVWNCVLWHFVSLGSVCLHHITIEINETIATLVSLQNDVYFVTCLNSSSFYKKIVFNSWGGRAKIFGQNYIFFILFVCGSRAQ